MGILHTDSLAATVDAINEAHFLGQAPTKAQRVEAARWIAGRQGLAGSYAGMFAPTDEDFAEGIRVFTGERFATRAGTSHVLGEEACRALILLDVTDAKVRGAIERATAGMSERLADACRREQVAGRPLPGHYCCGKCTAALWRHLAVGGMSVAQPRRWLDAGMKMLKGLRDGEGRWRRFPLHYTLTALVEMDTPAARAEMRYAAPALERTAHGSSDDRYAQRRRTLAEHVLARC